MKRLYHPCPVHSLLDCRRPVGPNRRRLGARPHTLGQHADDLVEACPVDAEHLAAPSGADLLVLLVQHSLKEGLDPVEPVLLVVAGDCDLSVCQGWLLTCDGSLDTIGWALEEKCGEWDLGWYGAMYRGAVGGAGCAGT